MLLGSAPSPQAVDAYSVDRHVPAGTAPSFICLAADDDVVPPFPNGIALLGALRAAKAFLIEKGLNPQLVTINSWNEWTECSYLEPDKLHGYGYLEAIARTFT